MLLHPTEMHIQFVQVLQQGSQGCALGHLGKGVDILGEALATVAVLAVGTWNIGVGVIDVTRETTVLLILCNRDLQRMQPHLLCPLILSNLNMCHLLPELPHQRFHGYMY